MIRRKLWDVGICLLVAAFLSMGASKLIYGWISVFSYRLFWILSESMEPVIKENRMVVGKLIGEDDLVVGEIYAYRRGGIFGREIVIHRLVRITEEGNYIFQGDNNKEPDGAVERGQIGYRIVWY